MNKYNLTWIDFANKKRCRLTKAINTLVVISWRKLNVVLFYSYHTKAINTLVVISWRKLNVVLFYSYHSSQLYEIII